MLTPRNPIEEAEVAPGALGLLYDNTPELTTADVRPFVWAVLLYRGAVKDSEVIHSISSVCAHSELYSGWSEFLDVEDNRTRLQWLVDEVLGEMVSSGILRYSMKADLWVLNANDLHLSEIIKAVAGVNGSLPKAYIADREGY